MTDNSVAGPFRAREGGRIEYVGNKVHGPIPDVRTFVDDVGARVDSLHNNAYWASLSRINNSINSSVTAFFNEMGALFMPLPLTTRMISSPGAVYGKGAIDYTTDTSPITLKWFDRPEEIFLAESSQIYLEIALMQATVDHVFANYHSFRKEPADSTHVPEFHHVEYEGRVDQARNVQTAEALLKRIVDDILTKHPDDLGAFLTEDQITGLEAAISKGVIRMTLAEALKELKTATGDSAYDTFSLQNFGSWEEVKLTELAGGFVGVSRMPLLEVPFYHAQIDGEEPAVADCTDIIWPGYRETIGSGHRVRSRQELERKAEIFNLPAEDYEPYMRTRKFDDYVTTSGFGMGWERLLQGLLQMPVITSSMLFPRVHDTMKP